MAIADRTGQSRKRRLLLNSYDSDTDNSNGGNNDIDSGLDANGRQHDNVAPRPDQSHNGGTAVNEEDLSKESAMLDLEDSAFQAGRDGIVTNGGGRSDKDSITDISAQFKASDELYYATLAGRACGENYARHSLASILVDLQCIREYRTSAHGKGGMPYFELECLGQDGQWYWLAESDIQRSFPSAVGTFWGCGPEDWRTRNSTGGLEATAGDRWRWCSG